jgi:hypothetical protein
MIELGEYPSHNWDATGDCLRCGKKGAGFGNRNEKCPAAEEELWRLHGQKREEE